MAASRENKRTGGKIRARARCRLLRARSHVCWYAPRMHAPLRRKRLDSAALYMDRADVSIRGHLPCVRGPQVRRASRELLDFLTGFLAPCTQLRCSTSTSRRVTTSPTRPSSSGSRVRQLPPCASSAAQPRPTGDTYPHQSAHMYRRNCWRTFCRGDKLEPVPCPWTDTGLDF